MKGLFFYYTPYYLLWLAIKTPHLNKIFDPKNPIVLNFDQ